MPAMTPAAAPGAIGGEAGHGRDGPEDHGAGEAQRCGERPAHQRTGADRLIVAVRAPGWRTGILPSAVCSSCAGHDDADAGTARIENGSERPRDATTPARPRRGR